jgi:hypothetical protein
MSEDRLEYLKDTLDKQKNRPAVVLRRSDTEWAVDEVERLRAFKSAVVDAYAGSTYAPALADRLTEIIGKEAKP